MTTTTTTTTTTTVLAAAERIGGRFEPHHVTPALLAAATAYALDYRGTFAFLVSMRRAAERRPLTLAQAKGVLNCMTAEARRSAAAATVPAASGPTAGPVAAVVADGRYTVVMGADRCTLRLGPGFADKPGTQIAAYLSGSDNDRNYAAFATVSGSTFSPWRRYAGTTRVLVMLETLLNLSDPAMAGLAYALASGNCYRCGRTLTVPASIGRGLGPDCARMVGAA